MRLKDIMENIFDTIYDTSKKYADGKNLVAGANIAGFVKVCEAMKQQGVAY
jgi:glutamate dehydrogenase (NADP+)